MAIGDTSVADDELFKAWRRAIEASIDLMSKQHERDMQEMEAQLQELRDAIKAIRESLPTP